MARRQKNEKGSSKNSLNLLMKNFKMSHPVLPEFFFYTFLAMARYNLRPPPPIAIYYFQQVLIVKQFWGRRNVGSQRSHGRWECLSLSSTGKDVKRSRMKEPTKMWLAIRSVLEVTKTKAPKNKLLPKRIPTPLIITHSYSYFYVSNTNLFCSQFSTLYASCQTQI